MNNELELIQKNLDEINKNIVKSHQEHFNWVNALAQNQARIEKKFNDIHPATWHPYYHPGMPISSAYPEIFNKYGEKMNVFFISDHEFAKMPNEKISRYILWDRYNYGLDVHFYTHDEIFRPVGKPKRRFAAMVEPYSIQPKSYENVLSNKDYIEKNFEAIFTFDSRILSTIENAKFAPLAANVWYGRNIEGTMIEGVREGWSGDGELKDEIKISAENYKFKTKNISMVASAKEMCPMHILRKQIAFKCKTLPNVDTYGKFDGGDYVSRELPLEKYRYTVSVENLISPLYFTEKILDCFLAQTIPIYIGATEIGKFFNPDGIIQFNVGDLNRIEEILARCTPEEYERRLPAVIDNFNRVQKYRNQTRWDDIYEIYFKTKKGW